MQLPPYAYVPGLTQRHDEALFIELHRSVRSDMAREDLANSAAWRAGQLFFDNEFYWEAHEALEPVWMACAPNSVERNAVQALIQAANAGLKLRMGRPKAVLRLCDMAQEHLDACGTDQQAVMGLVLTELANCVTRFRNQAHEIVQ